MELRIIGFVLLLGHEYYVCSLDCRQSLGHSNNRVTSCKLTKCAIMRRFFVV